MDRLKRPTRCRGTIYEQGWSERCKGTRFERVEQDGEVRFVCKDCGHENYPSTRRTELREAQCEVCKQPFLWRYEHRSHFDEKAPGRCRACNIALKAQAARQLAQRLFERLPEERRRIAMAVERHRTRRPKVA